MVQFKGGFIARRAPQDPPSGHPSHQLPNKEEPTTSSDESSTIGMRQLFDEESCTYTYLLWDKETEDAILIDPVDTQVKRDLLVTTTLNLVYVVNTHCHADHISSSRALKKKVRSLQSVISKASGAKADELLNHGDEIHFGNRYVTALATPGHTRGCLCFLLDDKTAVLTGDALLVNGSCSRIEDFQDGSAETLYDSIHRELFTLPDDTLVFPGHDYNGQTHSTIGKEKAENPFVGGGKTKEEFVEQMKQQVDARPPYSSKIMDVAVPANLQDGAKPFFIRSLRTRIKERWGVFG